MKSEIPAQAVIEARTRNDEVEKVARAVPGPAHQTGMTDDQHLAARDTGVAASLRGFEIAAQDEVENEILIRQSLRRGPALRFSAPLQDLDLGLPEAAFGPFEPGKTPGVENVERAASV